MLEAVLRDATSPALRKTAFMSNVAASGAPVIALANLVLTSVPYFGV
jgi:hypothetical protein